MKAKLYVRVLKLYEREWPWERGCTSGFRTVRAGSKGTGSKVVYGRSSTGGYLSSILGTLR